MAGYTKRRLSGAALGKVTERFKALSEPMRLRLLYALMDSERTVSELVKETGGVQANVSKHLSVLLDAGILGRRKQGTSAYYRIVDESIFELCDLVCGSIHDRLVAELDELGATPRR
ncbi:MAG: winged helix-turn-helix transcriptional regulator [Rubrobacter sp.]|jgi:ArsR family transcriptional regulator|nr:winged helix-turn-helix transcriptional regulator [Rubrobacter sp.]